MVRQYTEAIEFLEDMFRRNLGAGFGRSPLIEALHLAGREQESFQERRAMWEAQGQSDLVAALDRGYEEAGLRGAYRLAADTLAARARTGDARPINTAALYTLAGDRESAIDWLYQAFEARNQNMPYMGVIPLYEGLHDEPRFRDLMRLMNLRIVTGPGGVD